MISIYSDGSSSGKATGAIGWAWVLVTDGNVHSVGYGGLPTGTNNQSELLGAIKGIEAYLDSCHRLDMLVCGRDLDEIELVSDSRYVLGCASGAWNPTKNMELVARLIYLKSYVGRLRWVPGHSKADSLDAEMNSRADSMAKLGKSEQVLTSAPESEIITDEVE